MQIRLSVVDPLGTRPDASTGGGVTGAVVRVVDVLVTAPAGTALAAVVSGLVAAVAGGDAPSSVLYAGAERLDPQRCVLGEPPLTDGAMLSLGAPTDPGPEPDAAAAQLHVVAGPDAGGVHLLHGGQIRVGRSADADVPLDDPDVSRLHCAVTLAADGQVSVMDLGSTNGTTVDGRPLDGRPVRLSPGSLLRLGESALRVVVAGDAARPAPVPTAADGEGHVRVMFGEAKDPTVQADPVTDETRHAYGDVTWGPAADTPPTAHAVVPEQGGAPGVERTHSGTPPRGTALPRTPRKRGGLGRLLRRGGRDEQDQQHEIHEPYALRAPQAPEEPRDEAAPVAPAGSPPAAETWPDAAALLLTALGPGPRLWERAPGHPEALAVRLGTVDRAGPGGAGLLPAVPVTVGLAEAGALGLAGPRARLAGLARCTLAQLAALHAPDRLEIVLIATDRARPVEQRLAEWSWLGWLPHVRPAHGQDCRLLLAYDREQAAARTGELLRRLDDHAAGHRAGTAPGHPSAAKEPVSTVVVVDGDPGSATLREAAVRLAAEGAAAGIHVVCLAETPPTSPASPVTDTYETACEQNPAFRACGAAALLSGDVATALRLHRAAHGQLVGHGTVASVDAVSLPWAERFARALAPLRTDAATPGGHARVSAPLPQMARLLDELGLARATPASLMARWAAAADDPESLGGRVWTVLGAGPRGPVGVDLASDGPHLLIEGPTGSGRTELLRSVAASLAAAERPDRLGIVLIDGQGSTAERTDGLRVCTDLPHVTTHLAANDPVRMREFAQSLTTELKRRAELIGRTHFTEWHTQRAVSGRMVAQRSGPSGAADLDTPPSSTMRLRPAAAREKVESAPPLPRLVVVVDDLDALLAPPLGSPGRPSAGSVVRALEAVAREGERLGVHLVAAFASGGGPGWAVGPRVLLDAVVSGPDEAAPGRGRLLAADGREVGLQAGRVTGRIPRTATQRPTVVALDWARMGDPPDRRPVRELGNGPTDLALLASALERAARSVSAQEVPSLL